MMARSLRAGHALSGAFQLVADRDARAHRRRVRPRLRGAAAGDAAGTRRPRDGRARPSNGDLKIFAVSVIIQKETGGNLAEILEGSPPRSGNATASRQAPCAHRRGARQRMVREPDAHRTRHLPRLHLAGLHGPARRQRPGAHDPGRWRRCMDGRSRLVPAADAFRLLGDHGAHRLDGSGDHGGLPRRVVGCRRDGLLHRGHPKRSRPSPATAAGSLARSPGTRARRRAQAARFVAKGLAPSPSSRAREWRNSTR